MAALEKSLDRPTWVIHLTKRTGPLSSSRETWVGKADNREAANAAALAWVEDAAFYVSYADGPFVPLRERDRLRAESERLASVLRGLSVTPCREWQDETNDRCNVPAEFVLWGKLFPKEALGPRCYDHAAMHAGHRALGDPAWAILDLRPALRLLIDLAPASDDQQEPTT